MLTVLQVIGAPKYFGRIWNFVKGWIDPGTAATIDIIPSAEVSTTLTAYIDSQNIPKKFGGTLDFQVGTVPNLDRAAGTVLSDALISDSTALQGPFKWMTNGEGQRLAIATGTVQGLPRHATSAYK